MSKIIYYVYIYKKKKLSDYSVRKFLRNIDSGIKIWKCIPNFMLSY